MADSYPPVPDDTGSSVARAVAREVERQLGAKLDPALYLVSTPIGNLGDITLRALAVLARADVVYCEDTRRSRALVEHFSLKAALRPYHEYNATAQRPRILANLAEGKCVALISDAGTPLISDPGFKLVREVVDAGFAAVSVPGASALLAGLVCAGLPTDAFFFAGFLPPRSGPRKVRIEALRRVEATLVFYEAPSRVADALGDLGAVLGARPAAVARELTKLHETVARGSLIDLAERFQSREERGEFVIVVGPPGNHEVSDVDIERALAEALDAMRLKDAAKAVADALGVSRNRVYDLGLKLKGGRGG